MFLLDDPLIAIASGSLCQQQQQPKFGARAELRQ
jgi:hypothetical protein